MTGNMLTKSDKEIILIALKSLKETFGFLRGFGKEKSLDEIDLEILISKIEKTLK